MIVKHAYYAKSFDLILLLVHGAGKHFESIILILANIQPLLYAYYSYHLNSGDHHK